MGKMKSGPRIFMAVLLAAACLAASPASRQARFLTFSAKDSNGIYLRDLKREEVSLWVDGQPVDVAYLGYKNVETAYIFLVENSFRTAQFSVSVPQWGQINVVDQIRYGLQDEFFPEIVQTGPILLAEFGLEHKVLQDFTTYDDQLAYALRKLQPKPGIADLRVIPVGRHMLWAVDILRKRPEKRKILVLFTSSVDRESFQNLEEYKYTLSLYDVELYVISFAGRVNSVIGHSHEERMNQYYFKQLTKATSGKFYLTGEYKYIDEFMGDLRTRLAHCYTLGFYVEPDDDRRERKVELRARSKKVKVTHRETIVY